MLHSSRPRARARARVADARTGRTRTSPALPARPCPPTPRSGLYCSSCSSRSTCRSMSWVSPRSPYSREAMSRMSLVPATDVFPEIQSGVSALTYWRGCVTTTAVSRTAPLCRCAAVPLCRSAAVPPRGLIGSRVPHESISAGVVEQPFSPPQPPQPPCSSS